MLAETVDELRTIAVTTPDASGYFPAMYARVTERIHQAASDGRFGDGDGMVRFAHAFADFYLRPRRGEVARHQHRPGRAAPRHPSRSTRASACSRI